MKQELKVNAVVHVGHTVPELVCRMGTEADTAVTQRMDPKSLRNTLDTIIHQCADILLTMNALQEGKSDVIHGANCTKVPHINGTSYMHTPEDDTPYQDDRVWYCGRCHKHLPKVTT